MELPPLVRAGLLCGRILLWGFLASGILMVLACLILGSAAVLDINLFGRRMDPDEAMKFILGALFATVWTIACWILVRIFSNQALILGLVTRKDFEECFGSSTSTISDDEEQTPLNSATSLSSETNRRLVYIFFAMLLVSIVGVNLLVQFENQQKENTLKKEPAVNKAKVRADREVDWRQWHQQISEITELVEAFGGEVSGEPKIGIRDFSVWLSGKINLSDSDFGDAELAKLIRLDRPHELYFGKNHVPENIGIRGLRLDRTEVTDAGLADLQEKHKLTELSLIETAVTDAGLANLQQLSNLQVLRLDRTGISDRGLDALKGLANLKTLGLWDTQVTAEGLAQLRQALPNCKVFADHETSGGRVFHNKEEMEDFFATEGYVGIGRVGDIQWPASVASEKEAMNEITFERSNGGKHHYPGLDGYLLKVVALEGAAGTEVFFVFRSEERVEPAREDSFRRTYRS